ncbi:hypothetical protein AYO38_08110 [bacterium SCGC AG-212-C10]|nr:hypothetical protein AYO38_08110 [bacterium SCGC AG-212-C10]
MVVSLTLGAVVGVGHAQPSLALVTITVNSNVDGTNAALAGNATCDLREAIRAANNNAPIGQCPGGSAGIDEIRFNVAGSTIITVTAAANLPSFTEPIDLDGSNGANPTIEIDGNLAAASVLTLNVGSSGSTIANIYVYNGAADGIRIRGTVNNTTIDGVVSGLDSANNLIGNGADGFRAEGASTGVTIRNCIAGANGDDGIDFTDVTTALVTGCRIGVDPTDTVAPNINNGIEINSSSGVVIGGDIDGVPAATFNVIAGNFNSGIDWRNSAGAGNKIIGNYIGTNPAHTLLFGNFFHGVHLANSSNIQVGGTTHTPWTCDNECNLISGNGIVGAAEGIHINNPNIAGGSHLIRGNFIGTDLAGATALGNDDKGIAIVDSASNTIGGSVSGAGNLISGNFSFGVRVAGTSTSTTITGNRIGSDSTGTLPIGNGRSGIALLSDGNSVGGPGSLERNILCDNFDDGVHVEGSNNIIQNNSIGIGEIGGDCGNHANGVHIESGNNNQVGVSGRGNIISYNDDDGVDIEDSDNSVIGNLIGLTTTDVPAGNGDDGIVIAGSDIKVGDGTAIGANVISSNGDDGIQVEEDSAVIIGNLIGTDSGGLLDRGNGDGTANDSGIAVYAGTDTQIGGTAAGEANIIAFNKGNGVAVYQNEGHTIRVNSIHSNQFLGIDLDVDGATPADAVTPNDALDADGGANALQNFPVLTYAGGTNILGSLNTEPAVGNYDIDFFTSPTCDPSGFGEGKTYIGSTTVATNAGGTAAINFNAAANIPAKSCVTATATSQGNIRIGGDGTSEFSKGIYADTTDVRVDKAMTPFVSTRGATVTYRIRVRASVLPAQSVVLTDVLPPFHRFQGWVGAAPAGCNTLGTNTNGTITCNFGNMAPGTSKLITFTATLPLPGEVADGMPLNKATVTTTTIQNNTTNDTATAKATLP